MCFFSKKQCQNAGTEKCQTCYHGSEFEFSDYNDIRCISFNDGGVGICDWIVEAQMADSDPPSRICLECTHYHETLADLNKEEKSEQLKQTLPAN